MFEKHLWKSDILSKDARHRPENVTLPQAFLKHFAGTSQLPDFYIKGILVENGLIFEVNFGSVSGIFDA